MPIMRTGHITPLHQPSLQRICALTMLLSLGACSRTNSESQHEKQQENKMTASSVHEFQLTTIDGTPQPLKNLQGKVLLMVNVASECGFTRQYTGLQKLHEEYESKGLIVMGIPANEFGGQEPGSNEEIQGFCSSKFHVTFPMYEKIIVKGTGQDPLYQYLTNQKGQVTWNFNKFLVGKDGKVIEHFESKVEPESSELRTAIERALAG